MTLIVYKNKVLSADTRTSFSSSHFDGTVCSGCKKETHAVKEDSIKIQLLDSESDKAVFRGEKIRALATAGLVPVTRRLVKIIKAGKDLEEVHANYIDVAGETLERVGASALLLVCEEHVYEVEVPAKGGLEITKHQLTDFVSVGSITETAKWLSYIMADLTATEVVNACMAMNRTIGGEIYSVDFNQPKLELQKGQVFDPLEYVDSLAHTYKVGAEKIKSEANLSGKKPARKPVVKKPVTVSRTRKAVPKKT